MGHQLRSGQTWTLRVVKQKRSRKRIRLTFVLSFVGPHLLLVVGTGDREIAGQTDGFNPARFSVTMSVCFGLRLHGCTLAR
jgi:hypothetical protein